MIQTIRLTSLVTMLMIVMIVMSSVAAQNQNILEQTHQNTEAELRELQKILTNTKTQRLDLVQEIAEINKTKKSVNQALIEITARIRQVEKQISQTETRLNSLGETKKMLRQSLKEQQNLLAEIIAATQKLGRNPPPALLITPEDALASLRGAGLLAAIAPQVNQQTRIVADKLEEIKKITQEIETEKKELNKNLKNLIDDEARLVLLLDQKDQTAKKTREQLEEEQEKAEKLAVRANSLEELIGAIEKRIQTAASAAKSAKEIEAKRQDEQTKRLRQARAKIAQGEQHKPLPERSEVKVGRSEDEKSNRIPFQDTIGLLPRPVNGKLIHKFGSEDDIGNKRQNVTFESRPRSWVSSPADGWVVYAGPFRSYKKLVILGVGDGYHIILAGMEHISVHIGDYILKGEPIGRMGNQTNTNKNNDPLFFGGTLLYVEFRKGTKPIDPAPWWAVVNEEDNKDDS